MRWVLYVDMDAFYVSCELRDRPELRGRPVVVGPDPRLGFARGVVLSASYEARKFGLRSAMPAAQALRLCPEAVWLRASFDRYAALSRQVRELLARRGTGVQSFSIDEFALPIDADGPEEARAVGAEIQTAIRTELDLPASLGIASDRIVAKIASDRAKPAGIRVVPPEGIAEFLGPLGVEVVPGVGPKTAERLHAVGIRTLAELREAPIGRVRDAVGGFASELRSLAEGTPRPSSGLDPDRGPRSRSSAMTFGGDIGSLEPLQEATTDLAGGLAESLAQEGLHFQTVTVALRWEDFDRTQRSRTLPAAHNDAATLIGTAQRVLSEAWAEEQANARRRVRTLSIGVERLAERGGGQRTLDDFLASTKAMNAPSVGGAGPG